MIPLSRLTLAITKRQEFLLLLEEQIPSLFSNSNSSSHGILPNRLLNPSKGDLFRILQSEVLSLVLLMSRQDLASSTQLRLLLRRKKRSKSFLLQFRNNKLLR